MHLSFIARYFREMACATASLSQVCASEPVGCSYADWSIFEGTVDLKRDSGVSYL